MTDPEHQALGKELRARLKETTNAVLRLSGNEKLQQHNTVRSERPALRLCVSVVFGYVYVWMVLRRAVSQPVG